MFSLPLVPSQPFHKQSDATRASDCQPEHRSQRGAQLEHREIYFQMTCKTETEHVNYFLFLLNF